MGMLIFQSVRLRRFICLLGLLFAGMAGSALAESPKTFLKSLGGTWRGSGTIYISDKSKKAPVRCKITSTFNEAKRTLANRGRCATAQKKSRISGSIRYSATGNKLNGSYINALGNYVVTNSSGSISGSKMTLYTTFKNTSVSKISRTRNVVKRVSKRKFKVTVFEKINGSYKRRGTIIFTK